VFTKSEPLYNSKSQQGAVPHFLHQGRFSFDWFLILFSTELAAVWIKPFFDWFVQIYRGCVQGDAAKFTVRHVVFRHLHSMTPLCPAHFNLQKTCLLSSIHQAHRPNQSHKSWQHCFEKWKNAKSYSVVLHAEWKSWQACVLRNFSYCTRKWTAQCALSGTNAMHFKFSSPENSCCSVFV